MASGRGSSGGPRPILVVDDDRVVRLWITTQLTALRLVNPVIEAADGDEAFRILSDPNLHPALILLDIRMPGRDGLQLLRWLRKDSSHSDVAVVMLTITAEVNEVDEAYSLGISSYLVKPVNAGALEQAIRETGLPWLLVPDGEVSPISSASGIGAAVGARREVSESTISELRNRADTLARDLALCSRRDLLTGLSNRIGFEEKLAVSLKAPPRAGHVHLVAVVDLDDFQAVNTAHGTSVGDQVLKSTAHRLTAVVGRRGLTARIGGDEFAILVRQVRADRTAEMAEQIAGAVHHVVPTPGHRVKPSASVGVFAVDGEDTVECVLLRAGAAMYAAKNAGRGPVVFDPSRHESLIRRDQMIMELRQVTDREELVLHYQPVVDLASRRIIGAEALLRWQHPVLGLLPPARFLPTAEASGSIVDMGEWALRRACADAVAWQSEPGGTGIGVAVNMSQRQLTGDAIVELVGSSLAETGLAASLLTVEVTESALADESAGVARLLACIRSLGARVAMDDFGTGYSTMAELKQHPIDLLKLDRSMVDGIARTDEDWAVAAAIIRLAKSLRLTILAEGIETGAQLATLRSLGCDQGQGFLFAKPMPLPDFLALLQSPDGESALP
ncbi:MAG: EAL domain-containing protein [Candidatus Nanopelagicales bacterium]|nr:EAL domain-containing protein [Candidatus Nanopelagicales bacterium]